MTNRKSAYKPGFVKVSFPGSLPVPVQAGADGFVVAESLVLRINPPAGKW